MLTQFMMGHYDV